ncbi:MAG: 4Fe-4S binding protein, partial [Cyanobacteriota bacterium]
ARRGRDLPLRAPGWSAAPHVIGVCQPVVGLLGVGGSSLRLRRLLQPARWQWVGLSVLCLGLGLAGRWLVAA